MSAINFVVISFMPAIGVQVVRSRQTGQTAGSAFFDAPWSLCILAALAWLGPLAALCSGMQGTSLEASLQNVESQMQILQDFCRTA